MIATLSGRVAEKIGDSVIIDCAGVGYGVLVSIDDLVTLEVGQPAKLYIYEHIREAAHDLFGFTAPSAKQLFEQLLGVNGVGPKMALSILNIGSADSVKQSIANGDTKFISQANGVGKRVAERVVVDLKDKVGLSSSDTATSFLSASSSSTDEAEQALVSLGFDVADARQALAQVDATLPTEERIKQALRSR